MPSAELLIPFFLASVIFACVPGPGMFYMAAQTLALGPRAGWYAALGFHIASFVHIASAAFGLSLLLQTVPLLFTVVKLAGAIYLIWLGVRYLLGFGATFTQPGATAAKPARKALKDSMIVEVLNPKSVLFYFTFLPQFTDTSATLPLWAQVLVLGMIVNCLFTVTDALLILLSGAATRRLRASQRFNRLCQRLGGGILVALGTNLALSRQ